MKKKPLGGFRQVGWKPNWRRVNGIAPGLSVGTALWTVFHTEYGTGPGPGQKREDSFPLVTDTSRGRNRDRGADKT